MSKLKDALLEALEDKNYTKDEFLDLLTVVEDAIKPKSKSIETPIESVAKSDNTGGEEEDDDDEIDPVCPRCGKVVCSCHE